MPPAKFSPHQRRGIRVRVSSSSRSLYRAPRGADPRRHSPVTRPPLARHSPATGWSGHTSARHSLVTRTHLQRGKCWGGQLHTNMHPATESCPAWTVEAREALTPRGSVDCARRLLLVLPRSPGRPGEPRAERETPRVGSRMEPRARERDVVHTYNHDHAHVQGNVVGAPGPVRIHVWSNHAQDKTCDVQSPLAYQCAIEMHLTQSGLKKRADRTKRQ